MEDREHVAVRDDESVAPRPAATTLRAGVIGAGFIGGVHARSARLAGARLAGVATSSPARGREAAVRRGAERAYATPAELATADGIDVVHICTPNHVHAELAALRWSMGSTSCARSRWRSGLPTPTT